MKKTRKERRAEAKKNKVAFEPQYNGRVITKEEYYEEVALHRTTVKEQNKKIREMFNKKKSE
jgi:hypothetical protein